MAKLKSERHHWWPECVSSHWADANGGVHWLLPNGKIRRATPNNFGVIGNGHLIKLGDDPAEGSCWDTSFEAEFQNADSNFPRLINWLNSLDHRESNLDQPVRSRILPQPVEDEQFRALFECLTSLAARSPMHRETAISLAEHYRGPLPERERNSLIGANIQRTLRNAIRNNGSSGKMMVIFSPKREFIFGDGFFHNLTVQGEHWHHPKMLVPLTLSMSVLFTRPMSYTLEPKLVTFVASPPETDALNYAVHVYARNAIFYRSERPEVDDAFACGRHQVFANDRNSVDSLIYQIPGVAPRDPNMDSIIELMERYSER